MIKKFLKIQVIKRDWLNKYLYKYLRVSKIGSIHHRLLNQALLLYHFYNYYSCKFQFFEI